MIPEAFYFFIQLNSSINNFPHDLDGKRQYFDSVTISTIKDNKYERDRNTSTNAQ